MGLAHWLPTLVTAVVGAGAALVGWRRGALTSGGALAALAIGLATLAFGGVAWAIVLLAVFASASILSRAGRTAKAARQLAKGARRDAVQVVANTGWGALLAVMSFWPPTPALFAAFVGTMAAVAADTWATEIGTLAGGMPRLITTGRKVPPGTSGAVSLLGTGASAFAGLTIGTVAAASVAGWPPDAGIILRWAGLGLGAGVLGSLADSFLGASVQAMYYCPACDKLTEQRRHSCGSACRLVKGRPWLDNDAVNALTSVVGSIVGLLMWVWT
ncbi:MAG: DUF92 domain-containing protein [Actinobacteria bacterium]|nr:DUF92 domain-containing protein [Actinomycetota bacterium]